MKLTTGWWKARDGSKWHVDWVGSVMAAGHNDLEEVRIWTASGIMQTGNDAKDLLSPWTEPKEGSSEWANSLPVGTKVRWHSWHSFEYATRTIVGWVRPKTGLFFPGEFGAESKGWLLYTEPKLRPWKAEEVPDCWVRKKIDKYTRMKLISVDNWGVSFCNRSRQISGYYFYDCLQELEHSTDGGHNWLPCGVMEDVE